MSATTTRQSHGPRRNCILCCWCVYWDNGNMGRLLLVRCFGWISISEQLLPFPMLPHRSCCPQWSHSYGQTHNQECRFLQKVRRLSCPSTSLAEPFGSQTCQEQLRLLGLANSCSSHPAIKQWKSNTCSNDIGFWEEKVNNKAKKIYGSNLKFYQFGHNKGDVTLLMRLNMELLDQRIQNVGEFSNK